MENLNINYDKTVSNATVSMISAGAILVISVLIVLLVLVIKRWKGRFIPLGWICICFRSGGSFVRHRCVVGRIPKLAAGIRILERICQLYPKQLGAGSSHNVSYLYRCLRLKHP